MTARMKLTHGMTTPLPSRMIRPTGRRVAKPHSEDCRTLFSKILRGSRCVTGPVIVILLAACSSSKTPKRSEFGPSYKERLSAAEKAMKNSDLSMRSSFEKEIPKSMTNKSYKASAYNAKDATGIKRFSGADSAYHSRDFSGAGKNDPAGNKITREMEAQNKLASRMFRAPDSQFDTKVNHDDKKTFNKSGKTFMTHENLTGTKEMEKNKKPVILEPERPTYSEDDVKRLLNKG